MRDSRSMQAPFFCRSTADATLQEKVENWNRWAYDDPEFSHHYDQSVTIYVRQGGANLAFADGTQVDLKPGDTLTIRRGAQAVWTILSPIRNSYFYHGD